MHLDNFTIKNLEIFESFNNNKKSTLYHTINHTLTASGARMLRYHILHPLLDVNKINNRLNIIEELIKNNIIFDDIRTYLMEVSDIERIIGKLANE